MPNFLDWLFSSAGKAAQAGERVAAKEAAQGSKEVVAGLPSTATPGTTWRSRWSSKPKKVKAAAYGVGSIPLIWGASHMLSTPSSVSKEPLYQGAPDQTAAALEILNRYNQQAKAAAQERYDALSSNYGQSSRAALDDYIAAMNNYSTGAAQGIRDEFGRVSDRYGRDVAAADRTGAAGANAINEIYGAAANATRADNATGAAGSSSAGLTPVSGQRRLAPGRMERDGGTLANYLQDRAAIAARDAGFKAATTDEYAAALANDLKNQAYLTGIGARYGLERDLAAGQQQAQTSLQDLLAQIDGATMNQKMQLELAQAGTKGMTLANVDPLTRQTWTAMYDGFDQPTKDRIKASSGDQAVDANSFINWALATDPSMLYGQSQ